MKFSEIELKILFQSLYLISISDDIEIEQFKKENNLTDDEFDEITIRLRTMIDSMLTKMKYN